MQPVDSTQKPVLMGLLWGAFIPQCLLLFLNIRSWTLISGEAGTEEALLAGWLAFSQVFLLIFSAGNYLVIRSGLVNAGWPLYLMSLIFHAGYMLAFSFSISDVIPDSIQPWIVSEGNVGRWNITLMMPGAFLSLYGLTRIFFDGLNSRSSTLIVLGGLIGIPLLWYISVSVLQPLLKGDVSIAFFIIMMAIVVTLFLSLFIRLFDYLVFREATVSFVEKHYILAVLLGLAGPLGGLYLNQSIPFPADFQSYMVYALTVLNGLVLLWKPESQYFPAGRLFLRFLMLPFTLYFFMVFLPFLPLSLFAILAMGGGILMLVPLALGIFQGHTTRKDYLLVREVSGPATARMIALTGFLILPAGFITQAYMDKKALETAIEYFYSGDMTAEVKNTIDSERAAHALVQLRDRKAESQIPYLSGAYNYIVYGNMVLPDRKIERMYRWLTNANIPAVKDNTFGRMGSRPRDRFLIAPERDVDVVSVENTVIRPGTSVVHLELKNNTERTHTLYQEMIDIPSGVFITGMKLKIEKEWVPARIFDRKTAIWVFQKITEIRRDPALLIYKNLNQVELRVYPFPANGIREVEITFEYNPEADSVITLGEHRIDLNPENDQKVIITDQGVLIDQELIQKHTFIRDPYLHIILDYSAGSKKTASEYLQSIQETSESLGVENLQITAANLKVSDEVPEMVNVNDAEAVINQIERISLREGHGLWVQNALVRGILGSVSDSLADTDHPNTDYTKTGQLKNKPVFVVMADNRFDGETSPDLKNQSWLIPDMNGWYLHKNRVLTLESFGSETKQTPVVIFRVGGLLQVLSASDSGVLKTSGSDKIEIYNPEDGRFIAVNLNKSESSASTEWKEAAQAWNLAKQCSISSAKLEQKRAELLKLSREQSVLLPSTAMIVVESDSQWEILKRKEKQSLANHSALEFDEREASEPVWWIMALMLIGFVYMKERKRRAVIKQAI